MVDVKEEAERLVKAVLGRSNEDAVAVLVKAVSRSYDEKKLRERLLDEGLEAKKAAGLAKAAEALLSTSTGSRKRSRKKFEEFPEKAADKGAENAANGAGTEKKPKLDAKAAEDAMDKLKVKQVMAEAQRNIEEAKRRLKLPSTPVAPIHPVGGGFQPRPLMPTSMIAQPSLAPAEAGHFMQQALEKARRRAELSAKIAAKFPGAIGDVTTKPVPIALDSSGRAVDKTTGQALAMIGLQPTLKANLREQDLKDTKPVVVKAEPGLSKPTPEPTAEPSISYVDSRVQVKGPVRHRRTFKWGEKGEYEALANRERAKAKLDLLQAEISQASKKTGISSAVKLAMVAPKASELTQIEVPDTEWWDSYLFSQGASYDCIGAETEEKLLKNLPLETMKLINNLVEHPIQLKPPTEPHHPQFLKVYLTKQEKKKIRRQNRREIQREQQEKIRLGLMPPPEPKVKLTNLMRVLGTDAIQDPTKMEAAVRQQMAARVKKHEAANASRKLTKEQKSEKNSRKMAEDVSLGVHVAVYRVLDLSRQAHKFKVETNAKQLQMTGIVILHKDVNVVVVEGGPKQMKFFKNLMLKRIKWEAGKKPTEESESGAVSTGGEPVVLVWEGLVKHRNFGDIRFKACPLEKQARDFFLKFGVPQYWDMAYNGSILSQEMDNVL